MTMRVMRTSWSVLVVLLAAANGAWAADPAIAFGTRHAVALRTNGDVLTWGDNVSCQLGRPTTRNSVALPEVMLRNIREIAVSGSHSLAVSTDGKVYAWGSNDGGALGTGSPNDACEGPALVTSLEGKNIAHVTTGVNFSVAATATGELFCAGQNDMLQCPPAPRGGSPSFLPLSFPALTGVVALRAGAFHTLARTGDGRLFAFGRGLDGQLGNGSASHGAGFVSGLNGVVAFGAGIWHSVAVLADGTAWAWGNDSKSQLCDGATVNRKTPARIAIPGAATIVDAAVGAHGTMLRSGDGVLLVCGDNQFASLGVPAAPIVGSPTRVDGVLLRSPVYASGGYFGAVSPDGCSVRMAGQTDSGIVGSNGPTLTAFTARQGLSLCAPASTAPQSDLVREYARGGTAGCWAPRVEQDAAASPRFASLHQAMVAVEDLLKKNAAFMTAPEPARYRTTLSAGPSETSGARMHVKVVPERKSDGARLWTTGCGVIPQLDRIGGAIGQVSIFFNTDARDQFIGPLGEAPKLTGHVGGYPVYGHWVVITKDGRLPWIPRALADGAIGVTADPAFPDMKTPQRVQLITVLISVPPHAKQADWEKRITDAFDFAALAALLK